MRFLTAGAVPLGSIAGGVLGEMLGLRLAIGVAAAAILVAILWIFFSPVRAVKNVTDPDLRSLTDAEPAHTGFLNTDKMND